ncbi:MAG: hypothetical protein K2X28_02485 [Alphaproteobacteria bacterium]|nr:hypothetical protein [Alphaproteobacteria bacterium]
MNTLKPTRKSPYRLQQLIQNLAMTKRGGLIIAILYLLPLCVLLTGCGRKLPPQPPEDAIITYPRPYPNPKLEEWSTAEECPPPVLEVCSPAEVRSPVEGCSPAKKICGE